MGWTHFSDKKYFIATLLLFLIILGAGLSYFYDSHKRIVLLREYVEEEKEALDTSNDIFYPKEISQHSFFNKGEQDYCWFLGETTDNVNAIYYFRNHRGGLIKDQKPIVYVKPGDDRFSHYWETFYVNVPKGYEANAVKSLDGILKGEKEGLFKVSFSGVGSLGIMVPQDVQIENSSNEINFLDIYYNAQPVKMAVFEDDLTVYENGKIDHMPAVSPFKLSDSSSLFEVVRGEDLNGDGKFVDSYNLLNGKKGEVIYSPLKKLSYIYVKDSYPGLNDSSENAWKSFDQMVENKGAYIDFSRGSQGLEETTFFYSCPHVSS